MKSLVLDRLNVLYGSYHALREVSLALSEGQYVLLMGENGAGKSTLLRCAAGWQRPSSGVVSLFGHALEKNERQARQWIKLVPDTPQFYEEFTAWEHVGWVAEAHRIGEWQSTAEDLMTAFGIWSNKTAFPASFSRGMQYKLGLAMSLICEPKLLLLDEPFGPLDPYSQECLAQYLRSLADSGITILISTHVLPDSEPPDRVILVDQGEVIEDLSWNHVRDRYSGVAQSTIPVRVLQDALAVRRRLS